MPAPQARRTGSPAVTIPIFSIPPGLASRLALTDGVDCQAGHVGCISRRRNQTAQTVPPTCKRNELSSSAFKLATTLHARWVKPERGAGRPARTVFPRFSGPCLGRGRAGRGTICADLAKRDYPSLPTALFRSGKFMPRGRRLLYIPCARRNATPRTATQGAVAGKPDRIPPPSYGDDPAALATSRILFTLHRKLLPLPDGRRLGSIPH